MRNTILQGDALTVLRTVPTGIAQCCVTSPPYWGLRDYGHEEQYGLENDPQEFVQKLVEVFREVRRVLKEDGTLWLNLGDSYFGDSPPRKSSQEAFSSTWDASNTASRGGSRRSAARLRDLKPKDLVGVPWMVAFALRADGWHLRSDIIWAKGSMMPEPVKDRPTRSHEYIFLLTKTAQYYYDTEAVREETRNRRSVWVINPKSYEGAHFAVFPPELPELCILAGSQQGDLILDPFAGSGTTLAVAAGLRRDFLGIELKPDYVKLATARVENPVAESAQRDFFDEVMD